MPVVLENRGSQKLKAPARLFGWEDSLVVISPLGLIRNVHSGSYLELASPDSTDSESTVRAWRFDEQLTASGTTRLLGAGERSQARWIEVSVHPGVESFRVTLHGTALRASKPVPATAPDEIPADLYNNPDQILKNSPYFSLSDKVLKNVVSVRFQDGASMAMRQEAVDAVGGEVIGGQPFPGMEGYYLIRVEDDGTGKQLSEAIDRLNATPGVAAAEPEYLFNPGERALWLKPKDDTGWSTDWQIDPTKADGKNWALEAISAPLAWGCSTGDPATRVAILDAGFLSHPDLKPNIAYSVDLDRYAGMYRKNDHGTRVGSIIAAKGNNGQGISGVMWDAGLLLMEDSEKGISNFGDVVRNLRARFFGPAPDIKVQRMMMQQALARGASVVNISSGAIGISKMTDLPLQKRIDDIMLDVNAMKYILQKSSNKALVVVASGNEAGVDAAWTGYPILAAELPEQVIAVGAVSGVAADYASLWPRSAINSRNSPFPAEHRNLIQIYAPGENVAVLAEGAIADWAISTENGTSVAAPMVAGVAGLLKSFDPTLTSKEIKDLLIRGAEKGGRLVVGGGDGARGYVANAYESLKLAAERPGAPLCGNRVWTDGKSVFAQRGTGAETLVPDAGLPIEQLNVDVLHGGKTLRLGLNKDYHWLEAMYGHGMGGWSRVGALRDWRDFVAGSSGSFLSSRLRSHDGDTVLTIREERHRGAVHLTLATPGGTRHLATLVEPVTADTTRKLVCLERVAPLPDAHADSLGRGCIREITSLSWGNENVGWSAAYSPTGDKVVVVANRAVSQWLPEVSWERCPWDPEPGEPGPTECRKVQSLSLSRSATVYVVGIPDGRVTARWTVPGSDFSNLSVGEDGSELTHQVSQWRLRSTLGPSFLSKEFAWTYTPVQRSCSMEAHRLADGGRLATFGAGECATGVMGVTASPDRVANGRRGSRARPPRPGTR